LLGCGRHHNSVVRFGMNSEKKNKVIGSFDQFTGN
jgi:hypothetical protein